MQFTSQLEQGDWYILAAWFGVVGLLGLYGLGRAVGNLRQRLARRRLRAKPTATAAARTSAAPANAAYPASTESCHWRRVIEIIETGVCRAEATAAAHIAARQQIEAAEYALNRLRAEYARAVRPPAPAPAEMARSLRPLPAATRPEPLAA